MRGFKVRRSCAECDGLGYIWTVEDDRDRQHECEVCGGLGCVWADAVAEEERYRDDLIALDAFRERAITRALDLADTLMFPSDTYTWTYTTAEAWAGRLREDHRLVSETLLQDVRRFGPGGSIVLGYGGEDGALGLTSRKMFEVNGMTGALRVMSARVLEAQQRGRRQIGRAPVSSASAGYLSTPLGACPACAGSGAVLASIPEFRVECPTCRGHGSVWRSSDEWGAIPA